MNKTKRNNWIFVGLLLSVTFLYNWHNSYNRGPFSIHQWRQADCLSITTNYYQDNLPFLEPEIHWMDDYGNSRTVSEFPIIYYSVAQIWKITGKHYFVYRILVAFLVLTGLFYLFRLCNDLLKDPFWASIIVLFLFSSPLLAYYGNNFIANTPAFGLAMIASFHLYRFYKYHENRRLYFAAFFFLLGGLIKITALFGMLATIPAFSFLLLKSIRERRFSIHTFLPLILLGVGILTWYSYARSYNQVNIRGVFLQDLLPIWEIGSQKINEIRQLFFENIIKHYFDRVALSFLFVALLYIFYRWRRVNRFLMSVLITSMLGVVGFIMLFYQVFDVHDYYLINMLIFIPIVLITFFELLLRKNAKLLAKKWMKGLAVCIVLFLLYRGAVFTRMRYKTNDPIVTSSFYQNDEMINWLHWHYSKTMSSLEHIEPYLESIGIKKNDRVISLPDNSINISLYLMNRKGVTQYGWMPSTEIDRISYFKSIGIRYLVINDPEFLNKPFIQPYINNKIGQYGNVSIYKIQAD